LYFLYTKAGCLPFTDILEFQSFRLWSRELETYVSKKIFDNHLVGGVKDDKSFQHLEFCAVTTDEECNSVYPPNCINSDTEYRFRVNGPEKGYLQVEGHYVRIVSSFKHASTLELSGNDELGLRIAHVYEIGDENVFATSKFDEEGRPIVLEYPQKNRLRQRFDMIRSSTACKKIEC
jgi:hypothetical protein